MPHADLPSKKPDRRSSTAPLTPSVSARRLLVYGAGTLGATIVGTWALAEAATPDGVGVLTADLSGLGRTVGLLAAAAVGVPAAVLAYYRQRALDAANAVAAAQHQLAADEHDHKVLTDNREHQVGVERHLRDRYTTCAEQLGHDSAAIRLAGVYALASLADDWHAAGNIAEQKVCIDLLCAYLRTTRPTPATEVIEAVPGPTTVDPQEQQVRAAIVSIIRARTAAASGGEVSAWDPNGLDLRGSDLVSADFGGANLTGANLAKANLRGAFLGDTNLTRAWLADTNLTTAWLGSANLTGAYLAGANLTGALLAKANLTRVWLADTNLTDAELDGAILTGIQYTADVVWPVDFDPPPSSS
ncbi:pentapeptide repeat-containing protein [Rhodococcus rhodochrous]|uniref:pentapeptide repeat-containing protein n=1 Tax=Rhodococcus rhodochrous TaxID=1829 RepID=UPI001364C01C|nr:pentapeptide repeat-containing protein [Rhodococcus rhodochrous]